MGLIADLLKRKSVPDHHVNESLSMLDMLKEKRGAALQRYLELSVDPRKIPPPSAPSTMEDLDQLDRADSTVYSPPVQSMFYAGQDMFAQAEMSDPTQSDNPVETGINRFFDEFARQASTYNNTISDEK